MSLRVRPLTPSDEAAWDRYVLAHPLGTPFHLLAWRNAIEKTFRYSPRYLVAEESGTLRGVLPLFLVKGLLSGRVLLSTPFAVYGGPLADGDGELRAIRQAVEELGARERVQHVELRNAWEAQRLGFTPLDRYVTFTQALEGDEQSLLEGIPRKTRAAVRKALKFDFSSRSTREPGRFTDLYLANLRRLGTPAFPEEHFSNLLNAFGEAADIRETVLEGKTVAAVLTFHFRDQVLPYYGASDPEYNPFQPNNFMYWDLMRWGLAAGRRVFDFGRSKTQESGSFDFKSHWGMQMRPLPYEVLLVGRKQLPDFSPNNPRYKLFIALWRRLPLPVTRRLGPYLVKLVP